MSTVMHPAPPERPERPEGIPPRGAQRWHPWTALPALLAGFGAAAVGGAIISAVGIGLGAELDDPPAALSIPLLLWQDLCLLGAAVFFARLAGAVRPGDFGLRPTRLWPGVGLALLGWMSFFVFTALWVAAIGADPEREDLPQQLGADEGALALGAVALLVCVGAPIVEEVFFRGFLFGALRNWRGPLPAALLTGALFGVIHFGSADAAYLVPLAFFGVVLCLLYQRTGSLYPCMGLHCLNNSVAFGSTQSWTWEIVPLTAAALAVIALAARGARAAYRPASATS